MAKLTVTLPDGSPLELAAGATGADAAAAIGPRLAARRARDRGRRRASRPLRRAARRGGDRDRDRAQRRARRRGGAVADPPRRRPRDGDRGGRALAGDARSRSARRSTAASTTTSSSPTASGRARPTWSGSRRRCAEHIEADEPFERSDLPVAEAIERFRAADQPYKVELIEDLVARPGSRDGVAVSKRPVHRPLPRPARALDRADQGVQAELARRRLLARRRAPPDADPDLRHRLSLPGGARRATSSGSSLRGENDHRRLGPELGPVRVPRGGAGDAVLAAATGPCCCA